MQHHYHVIMCFCKQWKKAPWHFLLSFNEMVITDLKQTKSTAGKRDQGPQQVKNDLKSPVASYVRGLETTKTLQWSDKV
jgi:hypothetical protein